MHNDVMLIEAPEETCCDVEYKAVWIWDHGWKIFRKPGDTFAWRKLQNDIGAAKNRAEDRSVGDRDGRKDSVYIEC